MLLLITFSKMLPILSYTTSTTPNDLVGILELQKNNLTKALTPVEIQTQGFITLTHTYDELKKLNDIEKSIIAKDQDKIIAYVLAMTKHSRFDLPVLIPMFEVFDEISYHDKIISDYNYLVVGQACVDKEYRGQGVLDRCYLEYKNQFSGKYDFAISEIASTNFRSMKAHQRIGFKEIHKYKDLSNVEWLVVMWDWKK
jgi:ribosomal protein S18 acetylase RimI-like enzyme